MNESTDLLDRADARRHVFCPSKGFWDRFISEYWNRKPGIFDCPTKRPIVSHDRLMAHLHETVHSCLSDYDGSLRLYVGGRLSRGWPDEAMLASIRSTDCNSYFEELTRKLGGESVGLIINDFARHDRELWLRLRLFAHGLHRRVGLPARLVHTGLFAGNYSATPFGIHRDASGGFMFAVRGRKTVALWPFDYFEKKGIKPIDDRIYDDPQAYLDDAVVLSIEPGQVIYWPSSYWHVALSATQESHLAVTLGDWDMREHSIEMAKVIGALIAQELGSRNIRTKNWEQAAGLPADIQSLSQIVEAMALSGGFRNGLAVSWLKQASAGGYVRVPSLVSDRYLTVDDNIKRQFPVFCHSTDFGFFAFANGHVFHTSVPFAPELLNRICESKWTSVDSLVRGEAREQKDQTIELLTFLYQAAAIVRK